MLALTQSLDRRDFIRLGGIVLAANALPALAPAAPRPPLPRGGARSCILVYLLGGPPHLDMFDLKPQAPAEIRGPFRPIATSLPGVHICEHLPRLSRCAHKYALVRSVSHNNHNHTPMIYYTLTGRQVEQPGMDNDVRPPQRTDFPHVGAALARFKPRPGDLPGYIAIPELATRSSLSGEFRRVREPLRGGGAGILGPLFDPLSVQGEPGTEQAIPALRPPADVLAERMERRGTLLSVLGRRPVSGSERLGALQQQAFALSGSGRGRSSPFLLEGEPAAVRERYGRHRFGLAMLLARRLAEAGVPMTAVHYNEMTICDGWDTHSKNFHGLETELLPMLDQSLSALLEDLEQRGLLEQTLVVVMGEFGRTPRINRDAGRDHWGLCQSVLLAGGGIQGGRVHGSSDRIGAYPASDPVDPVDIHATIYHCMGLDPEQTIHDHLRRPHPLTHGAVVTALI